MPVITEYVHPQSMSFQNQRQVILLRDSGLTWACIASRVVNLRGKHPAEESCRRLYKTFNKRLGKREYKYKNCGRRPWKINKEAEAFLLKRLKELRGDCVCTSVTLQKELLKAKGVRVSSSVVRKALQRNGYKWLRRSKKPKFDQDQKKARLAFAKQALTMTQAQLDKHVTMSMDGVVLTVPPNKPVDRENFCKVGLTHVWRKEDEEHTEDLAGGTKYDKQFKGSRAVPLWGGIGPGGFGLVMFHERRKVNQSEWSAAVDSGNLLQACKACRPDRERGPWRLLCDNESFLNAPQSRAAHRRAGVQLWQIPQRSPDLNPVEMYWAWLRKRLREMDLDDLNKKRPPVGKIALKARVRSLLKSDKAKAVAQKCWGKFRAKCAMVVKKRGAAIRD